MKKSLLFAAIALMPAVSVAQDSFQFGIKGGVNLSKFSLGENVVTTRLNANGSPAVGVDGQLIRDNLRESLNSRTGTAFGVYARFGRNLYIQPEVLYSTKASSFDIVRTQNGQTQTETVNISTTSFDVPVLLGLKGGPLRVVAGPVVSFRIGDNQRFGEALRQYTTGSLNDAWAKAYYGYQIGGGLDLGRIGIDVRREGSFSDIAAVDLGTAGQTTQFSQKLKSWQVTLAYKIF
ncbi:outer membrane beta-barrel protein [Rudanella paleaurantiibacter]|uniref:Outer membrane beta-barrel protein n=1 Tax=Rudanella paleaurantiibacter TaxID=2614655 RepID=A0A7J5U5X4_9BACT|nr:MULTISPECIES: porin family protein [Rudanella]KAB7733244.1 outer membrane beta-barrel protein [Rudanella paleaurantiibacter]